MNLANERLIDSVTKVTELLRANQLLREEVDTLARSSESKDYELYSLNSENARLRERIEILETIVKASKQDYELMVNEHILDRVIKEHKKVIRVDDRIDNIPNNSIDKVYHELITLRDHNRVLEKRVKTLEK